MTACRYVARTEPRVLPDRHDPDCPGGDCTGCQPCPEVHCCVCGRAHVHLGACPECLAETRWELRRILEICGLLPPEVVNHGRPGEALMLLGPTAHPEAYGNRNMSALRGRLCKCARRKQACPANYGRMCPDAAAYLEDARDERHPLFVLGEWENLWRDVLDKPSDLKQTVVRAADFISREMHVMADLDEPDFAQFASELRGCRAYLEAVIHDERQGDRAGVRCFDCGGPLERRLKEPAHCGHRTPAREWLAVLRTYPEVPVKATEVAAAREACPSCDQGGFEDRQTCLVCHRVYTPGEYNVALRANLEDAQEFA